MCAIDFSEPSRGAHRYAAVILRITNADCAHLLVMSSRGATGIRRLFLGSVTERVVRATTVPILVTPPGDSGPGSANDLQKAIRRVLVPVDLTAAMEDQVRVGVRLGIILGAPLFIVHVVEPVRAFIPGHVHAANVDSERRDRAERRLRSLAEGFPTSLRTEILVVFGSLQRKSRKLRPLGRRGRLPCRESA